MYYWVCRNKGIGSIFGAGMQVQLLSVCFAGQMAGWGWSSTLGVELEATEFRA